MNYSQKRDMWAIIGVVALSAAAVAGGLQGCDNRPSLAEAQAVVNAATYDGSLGKPLPFPSPEDRESYAKSYLCINGHEYLNLTVHNTIPIFDETGRAKPC